ncbi:hypothetical protein [Kingella denitrificans]
MKLPSLLLPIVLLAACQSTAPAAPAAKSSLHPPQSAAPQYTERTLIVFYDPETGSEPLLQAVKDYGAEVGYQYKNLNGINILLARGQDIEAAQRHFRNVRGILSVSRDRIMHLH